MAQVVTRFECSASDEQWALLESPQRFRMISGGFGSGKSHIIALGTAQLCVRNQGLRGGLIGADFGRLDTDVLPILYQILDSAKPYPISHEWLPPDMKGARGRALLIGRGWLNTVLDVRSMNDPESIKGPNWAFAVGDEITLWPRRVPGKTEMVWGIIESRLRLPGGTHEFIGGGTPEGRANWTCDPGLFKVAPDDPEDLAQWMEDFACIRASTFSNRHIPTRMGHGLLRRLDPQQVEEKVYGYDAAGIGGAAYPFFDRSLNVYHRVRYDPFKGDLIVGLDFNVNPMSAVLCQYFRDELTVFDEIYLRNSTTMQMGAEIKRRARVLGIVNPERIEIHPDASGRARKTTGEPDFDALRNEGLTNLQYPHEGNPRVSLRLNCVNGAFHHQRVWIDSDCRHLIRECSQTAKDDAGQIIKTSDLGQISDALGYVVVPLMPIYDRSIGYSRAA